MGLLGKHRTRGYIRRVRVRTAETSTILRWGWTALWVSLTSPPHWRSTPCGMAPGASDWMSCSLSMGPMACWPRPRPRQRSVRWPCKAGGRCRWCVRPTGWCCMPRAVRLTFFARSQGGCYGNGRTSTPCSKGASIDQPLTPGLAAIVAWPPSSGTAGRETLKTLGAPSQTNCGPIEGVILDGGSM